MQSVNQFPRSVSLAAVSDPARCAVLGLKSTAVGLGEPLAETIRSVTIGHQFPFTGKLAFLPVRSSFAVLEMSL